MQNTFKLCSLFDIPILAHYSLPAYLILSVLISANGGTPSSILLAAVVNGPVLFLTVLIHELGHSLMAKHLKLTVQQILLWPLGGLAYINSSHASHCGHIMVSLAGPLTHIPMFIGWTIPYMYMNQWKVLPVLPVHTKAEAFVKTLLMEAAVMQVSLLAFNLFLPAFPLDGGRIFASTLMQCGCNPRKAAITTCVVSFPISLALIAYGIYGVFYGGILSAMTIFVGMWMIMQTYQLWVTTQNGTYMHHPLFQGVPDTEDSWTSPRGSDRT